MIQLASWSTSFTAGNNGDPFLVDLRSRLWPANHGRSRLTKRSDALALRSDRLGPVCERLHERLQEFAGAVAGDLALFIEQLVGVANIRFRLLHGRDVEKHERLPQMMIGAEGSD